MSIFKKTIVSFVILVGSTAFAQNVNIEEMQAASIRYMETRFELYPEVFQYVPRSMTDGKVVLNEKYESNSPLIVVQREKTGPLMTSAFQNNTEAFFAIWNTLNQREREFFATDYSFDTNRSRLHHAAMSPREVWSKSKPEDDASIVLELCKYVDVNKQDINGDTALSIAMWTAQGNFNIAKALISDCGANIELASNTGSTPLMLSAFWGHRDLFNMLIDAGADHWAADTQGKGVYYYFNQGRIKKAYEPSMNTVMIEKWLNENNHSFEEEALTRCTGFNDMSSIVSENSFINPESLEGVNFVVNEKEREQALEKLRQSLLEKCEHYGYKSCQVMISDKLISPVKGQGERTVIANRQVEIYYGLQEFYAVVMGSASGNPEDCKLDL